MFQDTDADKLPGERFRLSPVEKRRIETAIFAQLRFWFPETPSDNKQLLINQYQSQKTFKLNFAEIDNACGVRNAVSRDPASHSYFLKVIVPSVQKSITPDIADMLKKFTRLFFDEVVSIRPLSECTQEDLRQMQTQIQKQILQQLGLNKFNCNFIQAQNFVRNTLKECVQVHIENEEQYLDPEPLGRNLDTGEDISLVRLGIKQNLIPAEQQRKNTLIALQETIQEFIRKDAVENQESTAGITYPT